MRFSALVTTLVGFSLLAGTSSRASASDECTPSKMLLVLDRSSSMQTGTIGGVTKWSIAVDAIDTVAAAYENNIELGLNVFPNPDECSPGTTVVQPALAQHAAIMGQLTTPPPSGGNWTPMAQTLEAVAADPVMQSPDAPRYAVLITDGWQWCDPYDSTTRFDPVDAVSSLNAAGVTTFIVGFGGQVDALVLNMMAVEAGTARAGCDPSGDTPGLATACYFSAGDPAALLQSLMDIAVTVSAETCDGLDNNCDGQVDENVSQACASACGAGTETCIDGEFSACDAPAVETEVCDGVDNDCDGVIDPGCDCAVGDTRACGSDSETGSCTAGVQSCSQDGTWSDCLGAVGPVPESCDGEDNDCDGDTDEPDSTVGTLCGTGFACVDGDCEAIDPVDPAADEPAGGCGCASSNPSDFAGGLALLFVAMLFGRVRRRRHR